MGEYEALLAALEEFIMTDNQAVWTGKVQPLLEAVVKSKVKGTCRNAILRETGLFVTDTAGKDVMLTAAELQALRMAKTAAARAAVWREILASVGWAAPYVVMGIFVFTTAKDVHAMGRIVSSDNQKAYAEYMNKYMQYVIRTAELGRNISRFPPPMTYERWLNKDQNVAWWQER